MASLHCPRRGDVVWLAFDPQARHEQSGDRPALTLSPETYNRKVGLALFCPLSTKEKGYPFEVVIPPGSKASGVVLADQVKSLDWRARRSRFFCRVPDSTLAEVLGKIETLLK